MRVGGIVVTCVLVVMPRLGLGNQRADQQQQHGRQRRVKRDAIPTAMGKALKWQDEYPWQESHGQGAALSIVGLEVKAARSIGPW